MIHLRRYIDQLAEKVKDKEYEVQKTREELKKCNDRIESLENERDDTTRQLKSADDTDNMYVVCNGFNIVSKMTMLDKLRYG